MLGIPRQMEQVGRAGALNDGRAIIVLQKIGLDEVSTMLSWAGTPNDDRIDSPLRQLAKDISSEESTRSGQKYSHGG